VQNAPVPHIFSALFATAAVGGAYNVGEQGAYGRLAAWRSLAGLVGCAVDVGIDEIARQATTCLWTEFLSTNQWFYAVAWEIGVVCVNPNRHTIAVLAATDSD